MAFVNKSPKQTIFDISEKQRKCTQSQTRKIEVVHLKQFRNENDYVVNIKLCKQHPFRKFQPPSTNQLQTLLQDDIHQNFAIENKKAEYLQRLKKQKKQRIFKNSQIVSNINNLGPGQYHLPSTLNKNVQVKYKKTYSKKLEKIQFLQPGPGQYNPKTVQKHNLTIKYRNSSTKRLPQPQQIKLIYEENQSKQSKYQKRYPQGKVNYHQQASSSFRKSVINNKCFQLKKLLLKSKGNIQKENFSNEQYVPNENKHPSPCSYDRQIAMKKYFPQQYNDTLNNQYFRHSYLNKKLMVPNPHTYDIATKNIQKETSQPFLSGVSRNLIPQDLPKKQFYLDLRDQQHKIKVTNLGFGGKQTRFKQEKIKVDLGPGQYNTATQSSKSLGCLLFSCSSSKREIFQQLIENKIDIPGAGAYNLEQQFLQNKKKQQQITSQKVSPKISKKEQILTLFYIGKQNQSFMQKNKQNKEKNKKQLFFKLKAKKSRESQAHINKNTVGQQTFYSKSPNWNIQSFNVSFQNDKYTI